MRLDNMLPFRAAWLGIALLSMTARADQTLCSNENTGSDYNAVTDIYQSNGLCHDQCSGSYAYAIVQYQTCWCSNIAPADTLSTSQCSVDCPGYPSDKCGNADQGLFGYIQVGTPSGTAGGSSSSASSTSIPSSTTQSSTQEPETSYVSTTVVQTVTQTPSQSVSVSYVTPTSTTETTPTTTPATTSSRTTSSSSSKTVAPTPLAPVTSVIKTTISGAVVTQTVTSTPISAPGSPEDNIQIHRNNGLGAGAIAGIVIGVLAALAILAFAAFLLWRRKKKTEDSEQSPYSGSGAKKRIGRNVSVLSKAGLLTRNTGASMGERDHDEAYYSNATGQNSVRQSMMFAGATGVSPTSPLGSSHGSNGDRRMSQPMVYDQRLNPSALFSNAEANGSRISMQDTQDYSRPLGVMNPDIRASFDSRLSRAA